ncbi:MAG: LamG-like jellyroll fold domain-containing protein, partial [Verrucomicrobiales bacterium]
GYFINLLDATQSGGFERLSSRDGYAFETAVGTSGRLSYYSSATGWVATGVSAPPSGWTHVAWRNTSSAMELYVDGVLAFTGVRVPAPSGFMQLGSAFNNLEGFEGLMDDAFLWNGALTPVDISIIAAAGVANFFDDSDGDGLPTAWETQNGLNPNDNTGVNGAAGDPDTDGLTNAQELDRGTKPKDADTDDDGLNDSPEITAGTNPVRADTDGDGLSDGDEVNVRNTKPLLADTDGDSFTDGQEVAAGTDPLSAASAPPPSFYLVLHLNMEGDAQDSSASANHGSVLADAAFADDGSPGGGQALALTANEMGVNVPGSDSLSSNTLTLSYWVKPTTLQEGAGLERLTSRAGDTFETAIGNRAAVGGAEDLTLSYYQQTGWHNTGITLALNEWAHVAWRNSGSGPQDMSLFVNGVRVFSGPGLPSANPGSDFMNIGTRHNSVEGFEGLIDDVRLYRIPLSDAIIASIMNPAAQTPLEITSIARASGGTSVTLTIRSRGGRTYAVDYSTTLTPTGQPGGWAGLTDSLPSGGNQTVYVDTVTSNLPHAFYRVRDVTP